MRSFILYGVLLLITQVVGYAQVPAISSFDQVTDYPFSTVRINGSGFSANAAQLQVWFGSVKGTILTSTETSIAVRVPAGARVSSVEVINLNTKLSARSSKKFVLNFSGVQPFTTDFANNAFSNPDDIFDLCSCDFDGDGKPDMAGSKFRDGKSNIMLLRNTSTVAANNTTLNFAQTTLTLSVPTFSVACGDLNGDGKPELVASRGGTVTGSNIYVFENTSTAGNITFATPVALNLQTGDFAKELAIADLDRDGKPEIIVTNGQTNNLYIFDNNVSAGVINADAFTRVEKTVVGATNTLALDVADFNGDGWIDIAFAANTNAQRVFIYNNPANGTLNFSAITSILVSGSTNINDIASGDFNTDGRLDFVVADRGANKAFVYVNTGGFAFSSVNSTTGFPSPTAWGVDVADMNGDGLLDFVVGNRDFASPQLNIYINNGNATPGFAQNTIVTPKANWFVRAADFDGDAKPDIAITSTNNVASFSIDVWKNRNCHKPVIFNDDPVTICNGQTIELASIPMQGVAFSWSSGGTGPTKSITFADAPSTITLTAVGEGGACSQQASISVIAGAGSVPANPVINAPAAVCAGNTLTLSTTTAATQYFWTGPAGFTSTQQNPAGITNVSAVNAGTYSLQVQSGDCRSNVTTANVDVVEPASFSIATSTGSSKVCTGQAITLSINPVSGYDYQWKKNGSNIIGQTGASLSIASAGAADAAAYTVLVSHQTITCTSETSALNLQVISTPVASFTTTPALVCVGTAVNFNSAGSTFANTEAVAYAWEFGDGDVGTGQTTTHTYAAAQVGVVARLTLSYPGVTGCSNSTTRNFNVNAATPPEIVADPDVTDICADGSESVNLSVAGSFTSFSWSTGGSGSSITVTQPGTFTINTVDNNGCAGSDELILQPKPECDDPQGPIDITIPKVFSPNNDNINDFWVIANVENYPDCNMNVFDGRGRRVFEVVGFPVTGWDGTSNGKAVPEGTYYYVFGCPNAAPITGSVLIVR
jgi:gliding motility-associated-like protein